jgi:uncharacterized protein YraI
MNLSTRKLFFLLIALLVLMLTVLPAFAQAAVASVNTGAVNVRSGPGMQYGSIATLPFGFGVNLVARNTAGNWVLVALTNGVTGWVNLTYLFTNYPTRSLPVSEAPAAPSVVPTGTLSGALTPILRASPDPNGAVVATPAMGAAVTLIGRNFNSTWAQVRLANGTAGWIETWAVRGTVPVRSLQLTDGSVFVPGAPSVPPGGTTGGRIHVIRAGETLWGIARTYGVNIHTLAAANRIFNYDLIYAGQSLVIPG